MQTSRRTGLPLGRPGPGFKWAHIHCLVHPTVHRGIKKLAASRKLTVGAIVTELVTPHLDTPKKTTTRRHNGVA
jgi:hypothetical protein